MGDTATLQYGYIGPIVKYDKNDDGTIYVYGKAAGPDLDLDGQRMDPKWLKTAMPKWMEWGNVREQHSNIAAGVGIELTEDGDDWYLKAHIVDPGSVKKVVNKVLKGFSGGIVNGRVIKSASAPNGVINDGDLAEISLVDRPCNPTNIMSIAKSVGGGTLAPVEAEGPQVGDIDANGDEVVAVIDIPELEPAEAEVTVEKSAGWYRDVTRTVEDALAYRWSLPTDQAGRVITKAAGDDGEDSDEHADIAGAYAAIDKIADLIISEATSLKGGNLREVRDIETLISAVRALCCFIECEQDEDEPGIDDDDVHGYERGYDSIGTVVKAFGAVWDEPDDDAGPLDKSVTAEQRREAQDHGDTMPDGSYPITNQHQLESAVHLAGHSKTYSREKIMAHIRRQAKKHNLSIPEQASDKSAGVGQVGDATVVDVQAEIHKAVAAAQAEFGKAHEAELATLRADLEKALAAPKPGGPVTFKRANPTSSAPGQATQDPTSPEYWIALAKAPNLESSVERAYLAKAASLRKGAST